MQGVPYGTPHEEKEEPGYSARETSNRRSVSQPGRTGMAWGIAVALVGGGDRRTGGLRCV